MALEGVHGAVLQLVDVDAPPGVAQVGPRGVQPHYEEARLQQHGVHLPAHLHRALALHNVFSVNRVLPCGFFFPNPSRSPCGTTTAELDERWGL